MLTCDYKILAKALAARLTPCLDYLTHPDQTGYMKTRNIAENLAKTAEIISYTNNKQIATLIMTIDFKKCFDSLEHTAIFGSLHCFDFPPNFIKWVELLFKDFELCCQNNGFFSEYFNSERSVHQGCPLAGSLYLLTAQILHNLLCNSTQIKGITVHGVKALISQFADDTTLFLEYDCATLNAVIGTLESFYHCTGLSVNYDKTIIYRIGSIANTDAKLYTIKTFCWSNEPVSTLGIKFSTVPDRQLTNSINYEITFGKMDQITSQWLLRNSTLMGRVLIVNSLIASLFVYKMQVLPNLDPGHYITFNQIVQQFLWSGGSTKISARLLTKDKKQGGLRLVDLAARQTALKAQWVTKLQDENFLSSIFYKLVPKSSRAELWNCNIAPRHVTQLIDPSQSNFCFEILQAWCKVNFITPDNLDDILNQYLWFNSHILIDGKLIKFDEAVRKGVKYIHHIRHH